MTFTEKNDFALKELQSSQIWTNDYKPVLFRLLWWLGVKIAPPHYRSFLANFLLFSVLLGSVFGLLNAPVSWMMSDFGPLAQRAGNIGFGFLLALLNALYYRTNAARAGLTPWNEIRSA